MPSKPYEPREPVVKTLFAYSNNVCSFADAERGSPACEEQLTNPGWKRVKGRICHIRGESPGSARYEESMTDEARRAYDNLILLCPNHHTLIDDLEPDRYLPTERARSAGLRYPRIRRMAWRIATTKITRTGMPATASPASLTCPTPEASMRTTPPSRWSKVTFTRTTATEITTSRARVARMRRPVSVMILRRRAIHGR
jgi:hypothetical protein